MSRSSRESMRKKWSPYEKRKIEIEIENKREDEILFGKGTVVEPQRYRGGVHARLVITFHVFRFFPRAGTSCLYYYSGATLRPPSPFPPRVVPPRSFFLLLARRSGTIARPVVFVATESPPRRTARATSYTARLGRGDRGNMNA